MKIVQLAKILKENPLKIMLFITLLIRIALFFVPGFRIDISDWEGWAIRLNSTGFSNFYSSGFSDYFPGYLYILWGIGKVFNLAFPLVSFTSMPFEIFIKSVTTIFDIGSTYYIYKIILRYKPTHATWAALLYFANPAVIFNSSVWGQIDGIMIFFLIYSAYSLIEIKKSLRWSFLYSLGILVKPQSLILVPVMILSNIRFFNFYVALRGLIFIPLFLIIFSIPFFQRDLFGIFNLSLKSINVYPFTSLFAFNFWAIFDWWKNDSLFWFIFSYKTWGLIIFSLALILIIIPTLRKIKNLQVLYVAMSLSLMAFYLFSTRIHERYLLPFIPFFLIGSIIGKTKENFLIGIYLLVSLVHFLNLWYVYYYYNYVYNNLNNNYVYSNSNNVQNILYIFINNYNKFFSGILIICFLIVVTIYYKLAYVKKP